MNLQIMVETLSAIVQAYASILAIAGAFYIFVIERTQAEFREIEKKIDISAQYFGNYYSTLVPGFYQLFYEKGKEWLDDLIEKHQRDVNPYAMQNSPAYKDYAEYLSQYKKLRKRTGIWAFKYFYGLIALCSLLLLSTLFLLWSLSMYTYSVVYNLAYNIIFLGAMGGIVAFILYCLGLSKLYGKNNK